MSVDLANSRHAPTTKVPTSESSAEMFRRLYLVVIGFVVLWLAHSSYADFVQPNFEYTGMVYDPDVQSRMLPLLIATASLPLLFISPQLKPGHLPTLVVYTFVMASVFTVAPHFLGYDTFFPYSICLLISMTIIAIASNIELPIRPKGNEVLYRLFFWTALALAALPILATGVSNGLQMPGIEDIYELRKELELSGTTGYAIHAYTFAIGPLTMASGLYEGKLIRIVIAMALYVLCYAVTFQKTLMVAPVLVLAVWAIVSIWRAPRPWHFLVLYAVPLGAGLLLANWSEQWLPYANGVVLHRMYAMPGQIFAHYADYFSTNPHTWFSHVKGINLFVQYPYDTQLPLVIGEAYPGGNQNASFWAQDGLAGGGIYAIPVLSVAFGAVLIAINTAARDLDPRFSMPAIAMAAQRFSDGSLPTALLSGGLIFLIAMLWLAPRSALGKKPRL